jgi:NADH-quinone oxidoreductase subunit N
VVIAVINSVISAYYYLKIIRTVWIDDPAGEQPVKASFAPRLSLIIASIGIILLGVAPALFTRATEWGAHLFLP